MKPTDDIHELIKKLQIKASAKLDRKVHDGISKALAKSQETESAVTGPDIWRIITKGWVIKLAVAAAIFIIFSIGFSIGRWSKPTRLVPHSLNVTGYTSAVSVYPTALKTEDSFWLQKVHTAMQPRPYVQSRLDKTSLLNAYKQYLKEKYYE